MNSFIFDVFLHTEYEFIGKSWLSRQSSKKMERNVKKVKNVIPFDVIFF